MNERIPTLVAPGKVLVGKIQLIGHGGDGIMRVDGYNIFVPETTLGEEVKVRIIRTLPSFGFAEKIVRT